LDVNHIHR